MVSLMMLSEKQIKDQFERNIEDIDVLGQGFNAQSILANVYHITHPLATSLEAAEEIISIRTSSLASNWPKLIITWAIESLGPSNYESKKIRNCRSKMWENAFEVTVGAVAAEN